MKISNISFEIGSIDEAIDIIREAAKWLIENKKPLWKLEDLTREKLLKDNKVEEFYVLRVENKSAGAMILKWVDKFFWPDVEEGESGFIHKLCIRREFSGAGISSKIIEFACDECKKRGAKFLRLDCAGDRIELCQFYEKCGFEQVHRRMVGTFDVAFYQLRV